jgi:hypothetical protein
MKSERRKPNLNMLENKSLTNLRTKKKEEDPRRNMLKIFVMSFISKNSRNKLGKRKEKKQPSVNVFVRNYLQPKNTKSN